MSNLVEPSEAPGSAMSDGGSLRSVRMTPGPGHAVAVSLGTINISILCLAPSLASSASHYS